MQETAKFQETPRGGKNHATKHGTPGWDGPDFNPAKKNGFKKTTATNDQEGKGSKSTKERGGWGGGRRKSQNLKRTGNGTAQRFWHGGGEGRRKKKEKKKKKKKKKKRGGNGKKTDKKCILAQKGNCFWRRAKRAWLREPNHSNELVTNLGRGKAEGKKLGHRLKKKRGTVTSRLGQHFTEKK